LVDSFPAVLLGEERLVEAAVLGVAGASQEVVQDSAAQQVVQVEEEVEQALVLEEQVWIQAGPMERAFPVRELH
tara:strand:- start:11 stop:232 length:222 start_codon:yes stop_codon:yes gene_type:complete